MTKTFTADQVRELVKSQSENWKNLTLFAEARGVSVQYVSAVLTGHKPPGPRLTKPLGLKRTSTWVVDNGKAARRKAMAASLLRRDDDPKPDVIIAKAQTLGIRITSAPIGSMMFESWADMVIKAAYADHEAYGHAEWIGDREHEAELQSARSYREHYIAEANARSV